MSSLEPQEIEFSFSFAKTLSSAEQHSIWNSFIETIETESIFYGGGHDGFSLKGCLDLNDSRLSIEEGIELLKCFMAKHSNLIVELRTKNDA